MEQDAFPRGSSSSSTFIPKKRAAAAPVVEDVLFGEKHEDKHPKTKKHKPSPYQTPVGTLLGGGGVVQALPNKPATIEALSFTKLHKGLQLLAIVREVHAEYAVVSLPNRLSGYILKREKDVIPLHHALRVGQVLGVVIVKTAVEPSSDGSVRRRIQVSALPASCNSSIQKHQVRGRIASWEDHGCLVDLGNGARGFLKSSKIEGDYTVECQEDDEEKEPTIVYKKKPWRLNVGRLLDFVVEQSDSPSPQVVPLSLPRNGHTRALSFSQNNNNLTLSTLPPGTLVHCKVEGLAGNGLLVVFPLGGTAVRGAIEGAHLGGTWIPSTKQSEEWKFCMKNYQGKRLPARIVAVDPTTKVVRLSLQPHLLAMEPPSFLWHELKVGTVIKDATVVRLDPGVGALLALPNKPQDDDETTRPALWPPLDQDDSYKAATRIPTAYVHISKSTDGGRIAEAKFNKEFAPSTQHTCRILSTSHWMEGSASCATAESVVSAHVLSHGDLCPGQLYRNVLICGQLQGGSVMVDFGMGVKGIIPQQHLSDSIVSSDYRARVWKEKFAVGHKVDLRCLAVEARAKQCLATAKQSLVKCKPEQIATHYEGLTKGRHITGFISKIDDQGLFITFYNKVYGRVTARSLAAELGIEDHRADYHVGSVVTCRVVSCRKRIGKNLKKYEGDDSEDDEIVDGSKRGYWELNLSLNLQGTHDETEQEAASSHSSRRVNLHSGAVLPTKSMKVVELVPSKEKKTGGFIPGHAIVSIKSKYIIKEEDEMDLPYVECKLPFDQLQDSYSSEEIESAESLDKLAKKHLTVGKKIHKAGLILSDPKKSRDDYSSGLGHLPIVSLREKLIATAEKASVAATDEDSLLLPNEDTHLFMGATVQGYVAQVDPRHGSFVRFLNKVTGLVPKLKNGLNLPKYGTVTCRIVALDVTTTPIKILLKPASQSSKKGQKEKQPKQELPKIKPGDAIGDVKVQARSAARVRVKLLDDKFGGSGAKIRARVHVTMVDSPGWSVPAKSRKVTKVITKYHPFYKWQKGTIISDLICAAVDVRKGVAYVELTNRGLDDLNSQKLPAFIDSVAEVQPGMDVSVIVTDVPKANDGLWVHISPGLKGYIPGLEVSNDVKVLNNLKDYFPLGVRICCRVMNKELWRKQKSHSQKGGGGFDTEDDIVYLSLLLAGDDQFAKSPSSFKMKKPVRGDLLVGRLNRRTKQVRAPALMLDLRGGFTGRCCITELEESDEWTNMPLGRALLDSGKSTESKSEANKNIVTDEEMEKHEDEDENADHMDIEDDASDDQDPFAHGRYVSCRILAGVPSHPFVEVSLRPSRLEGDLDEDELPGEKEMVQGYVINTNKSGCFLRLSRCVEGRVILKELCDGFLNDPAASFPMGRLVVGKVKAVREHEKNKSPKKRKNTKEQIKASVDLDMRESTLLESQDKLEFEDIQIGSKYKGQVTRLESYGVFVRLENSRVSGLVHKSECSDNYIKNLADLYDPGDLVKVLVIKKQDDERKIGFSMKASHFNDSDDSDDSSVEEDSEDEDVSETLVSDHDDNDDELDSDDENFASKLAGKMALAADDNDGSQSSDDSEDDSSDDDSEEEDGEDEDGVKATAMDTNVGFDWGVGGTTQSKASGEEVMSDDDSESDSEESDDEVEDGAPSKTSHKSRKKAAARRKEESEISRREIALADGTADENPETATDFERLLASEPNRSEHWIRYMAYHLSLADIESARRVAHRAFDRIEFRQEGEKLNVWTALMTLELKYGSPKSLQETVDRACQHNNPKKVYLRVCELLEKDIDRSLSGGSTQATARADEMFEKMCKKFRSKKTVWIAHFHYLLQSGRHPEAHALLKRAITSLPDYKHAETMSKFAQLEMEHGSMERGRTIMDGLLAKYPKRLDLLFVYIDKQVKAGELEAARALFEGSTQRMKLSDKQMKSLFKKWYRMEEEHGTEASQEHVKDAARAYVERTSSAS